MTPAGRPPRQTGGVLFACGATVRVTAFAGARTGLARPDVFYFGNLVGDAGGRGGGAAPVVNALDLASTRAAVGRTGTAVAGFDFNRDGVVNAFDVLIARGNRGRGLALITAPDSPAPDAAVSPSSRVAPAGNTVRPPTRPQRRRSLDEVPVDVLGRTT